VIKEVRENPNFVCLLPLGDIKKGKVTLRGDLGSIHKNSL
jgi:hypothetical protein